MLLITPIKMKKKTQRFEQKTTKQPNQNQQQQTP
jgi:hypothetical protein